MYTRRMQGESEVERQTERLRVLAETSRSFSEAVHDYEKLLSTVVTRTTGHVAESSMVFLVSEDGGFLDMVAIHSVHPKMEPLLKELHASQRLAVAPTSATGRVACTGEPIFIPF